MENVLLYLPRPLKIQKKKNQNVQEIRTEHYLPIFDIEILHKVMFTYLLAEKFKRSHFEFFCENVVRGNSVQITSNFPAKSLSIYLNEFFSTLLIILWKFT